MSRSRKAAATLGTLLAFAAASAALADADSQIVYGAPVERPDAFTSDGTSIRSSASNLMSRCTA